MFCTGVVTDPGGGWYKEALRLVNRYGYGLPHLHRACA